MNTMTLAEWNAQPNMISAAELGLIDDVCEAVETIDADELEAYASTRTHWQHLAPERDNLIAALATKQQRLDLIDDKHERRWIKQEIAELITRINAYNKLIGN